MKRNHVKLTATAVGATGVVGLAALSLPIGAGAAPALPPMPPEQLVQSVLTAHPTPLSGTVQVNNSLGLPMPPTGDQQSQPLSNGTHDFRVWSDGQGRQRLSLPSEGGETTVVNDGSTVWQWDSAKREVVRAPKPSARHHQPPADPAATARDIVGKLRQSSDVAVEGTTRVAGRDAYELVLTPKSTEHTVLREVRMAVDAEHHTPLNLVVNSRGSDEPALRVGYTKIDATPQDPNLFQFTPPAGTQVKQLPHGPHQHKRGQQRPEVVGDGWDGVLVTRLPEHPGQNGHEGQGGHEMNPRALAQQVGKKINGPWGEGWVIGTKAGSALLTSDGRVAAGAVPEQELTSALQHP